MGIAAGSLPERVTIQQKTPGSPDARGYRTPTWTPYIPAWARIETLSGREAEVARGFAATVTHRLTIRRNTTVTPAMRVKFGSRYFSIDAILDDEHKVYQHLLCTESKEG